MYATDKMGVGAAPTPVTTVRRRLLWHFGSFIAVRDIGLLWFHFVVASVGARDTHMVTYFLSRYSPGEQLLKNLKHTSFFVWGLPALDSQRWQPRLVGDEVDDLRAKVLEQGLALEGLQRAGAGERGTSKVESRRPASREDGTDWVR